MATKIIEAWAYIDTSNREMVAHWHFRSDSGPETLLQQAFQHIEFLQKKVPERYLGTITKVRVYEYQINDQAEDGSLSNKRVLLNEHSVHQLPLRLV